LNEAKFREILIDEILLDPKFREILIDEIFCWPASAKKTKAKFFLKIGIFCWSASAEKTEFFDDPPFNFWPIFFSGLKTGTAF
jgi:hypothetical protein